MAYTKPSLISIRQLNFTIKLSITDGQKLAVAKNLSYSPLHMRMCISNCKRRRKRTITDGQEQTVAVALP
ncbi:hypothetical protein QJS10_CPB20g00847 [Acorus calamus]|uniref:Uncharacterized protein n=1 Tax=Acorus calamus TaxID=4465 RepID=A0AAV9C9W1_ACOCL|nr:hypothetical protein QJS10_CPB20g00847 [Acorus calamus]